MASSVNKVIVNGIVRIDLTDDTVSPDTLLKGVTAHDNSGTLITGTLEDKNISNVTISDSHIIIPPGVYSKGIDIVLENWTWDPLVFDSSLITDATGVASMEEIE